MKLFIFTGLTWADKNQDEGRERLYPVFGRGEYYISQRGSGLGERMYQAIREVLGRGSGMHPHGNRCTCLK